MTDYVRSSEITSAKERRTAHAFRSVKERRTYAKRLAVITILGLLAAFGLLVYNNPVPVTSPSFLPVVTRRMNAVLAMLIAASCQSLATVAFQSVTSNRIITPSLLGFEAVYSTIQTSMIFLFGATALIEFTGQGAFLIQVAAMVGVCLLLYGWLLTGKRADLQRMLLIGVVLGMGLRSLSSFMRRLLAPSEFDILQARLMGSVNNAEEAYFPISLVLVVTCAVLLFVYAPKLNALSLGENVATNLGLNYQKGVIFTLVLVSILMSVSTALIGSLNFFGFLVSAITYQLCRTYDHRYVLPMALSLGFLVLTASYFLMYHVFSAQGVVSIIIELFGGIAFLTMLVRKGDL